MHQHTTSFVERLHPAYPEIFRDLDSLEISTPANFPDTLCDTLRLHIQLVVSVPYVHQSKEHLTRQVK